MHSKSIICARCFAAALLLLCAQGIALGSGSPAKDDGGVSVSSVIRVGSGHGQAGPPTGKTLP